jgi:hypothetical protein
VCQPGYEDRVPAFEAQLSRRRPRLVEDQAVHVEYQIGERNFGLARLMPMVRMNRPILAF